MSLLLAIETSCDECAVALLDRYKFSSGLTVDEYLISDVIASQASTHTPYGGVVPELAAREHLSILPTLVAKVLKDARIQTETISAVAVTHGPGLKGCLLVGVTFGQAFASALGVTYVPVNHLEAHILSGQLLKEAPEFPYLALLVSGGHTLLILVRNVGDYDVLAQTRDDAAGEAFDKSATLLELPYPGGPALSKLAESGVAGKFELPAGMEHDEHSFSFSGLKTAVLRQIQRLRQAGELDKPSVRENLAADIQNAIITQLIAKTEQALAKEAVKGVVVTGGVAANLGLRERLAALCSKREVRFFSLPQKWCTDNAAMIAACAAARLDAGLWKDSSDLEVRPRWPVETL